MIERRQGIEPPTRIEFPVEFSGDAFVVDAALIGQLLHVPAARVPTLMREGQITSSCERGIDEHEGEFRLTFFYGNLRARLSTDAAGRILRKSVIAFGEKPRSGQLHRSGG